MLAFSSMCPQCHGAWDERLELIGTPATTFDDCAFRCDRCGLAFSNARQAAARVRITRTPELNVPPEARAGLSAALSGAINTANRPAKAQKFCSAHSEDAVTWTVVQGLLEARGLGALVGQVELRDPEAVLLWGHPVTGSAAPALARRFVEVSDRLGERPTRRSEPDVMVLWPGLLVLVEAKLGSANDRQPDYAGYATYLPAPDLFVVDDRAIAAEGSYQLTRNWVIGAALARELDVELRLINLGPGAIASDAARFAALLAQTPQRRFEHRRWAQVLGAVQTPRWLASFAADRALDAA